MKKLISTLSLIAAAANTMNKPTALVASTFAAIAALAVDLHAGSRSSANYSVPADVSDGGGRRATSTSYTNDGSAGLIAGISTVASPAETAKHGYIAQLYEVGGFTVNASPTTVNEGATRQVIGAHLLDDGTLLAINAASVAWSAASPLTIDASGLATAGIVYQNTIALVQGTYAGSTGSINLTILNVNTDDFGSYAGDGIGDDWQVQYFGLPPNAAAGPLLDPDGDGQNNRFEWIAGLIPTDANSAFKLRIVGSSQGENLIFGPTVAGRTYTVKYGFDFLDVPNWLPLPGGIVSDLGNQRTVTDTNASASPKKYYRVEIAK